MAGDDNNDSVAEERRTNERTDRGTHASDDHERRVWYGSSLARPKTNPACLPASAGVLTALSRML